MCVCVTEPMPLISSAASSAPKVVKRKAPSNPTAGSTEMDIAISRPVVPKPVSGQGLIPPPPNAEKLTENQSGQVKSEIKTTCFTNKTTTNITDMPTVPKIDHQKVVTIPPGSFSDQCTSGPEILMSSFKTEGSENLIQIEKSGRSRSRSPSLTPSLNLTPSPTPSPAPSPKCLRPYRKIDDVTTVKRQPKTGWL